MIEGRRRMKQMQGLLLLARLDEFPARRHHVEKIKLQRVTVMLQPQMLQLTYSSLADQNMLCPLGRMDLHGARLEQVLDGFVIYEAGNTLCKKIKLTDKEKATTDAWFLAIYTAITEHERIPISKSEYTGHKFSAMLTSSLRDGHTKEMEFEISAQLLLHARPVDKPSISWKVWKTWSELQSFNDELRVSYGAHMAHIIFPRNRKRDSLFGDFRKKSLQEIKQQQLALFIEQVFQMPEISTQPLFIEKLKEFLGFDSFFEIVNNENGQKYSNATASADPLHNSPLSIFAATELYKKPLDNELQGISLAAAESVKSNSDENFSQYCDNTDLDRTSPSLLRKFSFAASEEEEENFVSVIPETESKAMKKLHKKIVQTVRELVSYEEERVQEFQDQTKDFGRNKLSAMEYCAFLHGALGAQESCKLIPEMARLLPGELKRKELMEARAVIWRRTCGRQRRRSKQISESGVFIKHREAQKQFDHVHSRMRPKSDGFSTVTLDSERVEPIKLPERSLMAKTRLIPAIDSENELDRQLNHTLPVIPSYRAQLADPRRHLNRRASFNSMFGETLRTTSIKEEHPEDSDAVNEDSEESILDQSRNLSKEPLSACRMSVMSEKVLSGPSVSKHRNSSSHEDEYYDSTEDDDENHLSGHSYSNRNRQGSGSREIQVVKGKSRNFGNSQSQLVFAESDDSHSDGEQGISHTRFRRSQRRASRKFDVDDKMGPANEEENPVLARLKKQGAVNFMMQLH
ncbi:uncharacterized protein CCR75_003730 [Bremia lactucae]|uniref:PX domain-containing protein n=1 Tax=Bremia lactucae TaxID=4779 RepID=A0A976IGK4_BRELC|nr:hypothetical protein CCR75_003730 [Bremia lactucae]